MAATFVYTVKDSGGGTVTGSIEGDSLAMVAAKLRQSGYTIIKINEKGGAVDLGGNITLFKKKVKTKDLTIFSRQFATMINAGLALTKSLNILAQQTENPTLAEVLGAVQKDVESGQTLSEAMARHPKVFSNLFINMVRAGETGGVLDDVLMRVAEHYESELAIKGKIKSAMTYPVVMFVMAMLIIFAMLTFVVPVFVNMFDSLGGDLPAPTKALLAISGFIRGYWYLVIAGAVGLRFAFRAWKRTPSGRLTVDKIKLRLPVFGMLSTKLSLGRFTRTFGTLISSGVPILQALEIVADTASNEVIAATVRNTRTSIKEGETIAQPLSKSPIFPPMVVQMVSVGEETGALDTMLSKIADFYDEEVGAMVESLTALIEPLMIAFMGLMVGGILVSLYMPMFKLITLIK